MQFSYAVMLAWMYWTFVQCEGRVFRSAIWGYATTVDDEQSLARKVLFQDVVARAPM